MTLKEAQLIKRTAWANMQPRKKTEPTPQEKRMSLEATKMITYVACLNYAMCDFETQLLESNKFRHTIKYHFRKAQDIVSKAHESAFKMLYEVNPNTCRAYNEELERVWNIIDESILLPEPEKTFSIIMALIRLIDGLNKSISSRFVFREVNKIATISKFLEGLGQDAHIDNIISQNM